MNLFQNSCGGQHLLLLALQGGCTRRWRFLFPFGLHFLICKRGLLMIFNAIFIFRLLCACLLLLACIHYRFMRITYKYIVKGAWKLLCIVEISSIISVTALMPTEDCIFQVCSILNLKKNFFMVDLIQYMLKKHLLIGSFFFFFLR